MSSSRRLEVLRIYKRIIRLSKTWSAQDPTNSATERAYIREEVRRRFREHSAVAFVKLFPINFYCSPRSRTRPRCKSCLRRPKNGLTLPSTTKYPTTGPPICRPPLHTMSTQSRRRSSSADSTAPSQFPPLLSGSLPTALHEQLEPFLRAFFACTPIDDLALEQFVCALGVHQGIDSVVFCSPARTAFPAGGRYLRELCKRIIEKMQELGAEASDVLYECLCAAMSTTTEENGHFFRIFAFNLEAPANYIVIKEAAQQISNGTTGLSCWQSSFVLADFLLSAQLAGGELAGAKRVLELGAGCGLVGIALAALHTHLGVTLSDGSAPVLRRLAANVALNFGEGQHRVRTQRLDWTNYAAQELAPAELIVAADVVYDRSLLSALTNLVRTLMLMGRRRTTTNGSNCPANPPVVAYIACTLRDPDTMDAFLRTIDEFGLEISAIYEHNTASPGSFCAIRTPAEGKEKTIRFQPMFPVNACPRRNPFPRTRILRLTLGTENGSFNC